MKRGTILKLLVGLIVLCVLAVFTGSALAGSAVTQDWELLLETNTVNGGQVVSGSMDAVADAIDAGATIKVVECYVPVSGSSDTINISRFLDHANNRKDSSGNVVSLWGETDKVWHPSSGACEDDTVHLKITFAAAPEGYMSKYFIGACTDKLDNEVATLSHLRWYAHQ